MFLVMLLWFSHSHYKEKRHSHSQRLNHKHKKMVDHFLMIIIMFIIRAPMIMFLDVPTKTSATWQHNVRAYDYDYDRYVTNGNYIGFVCTWASCSDQEMYNFCFVLRLIAVENDLLENVLTKLKYTEMEEKVWLLGGIKYSWKMAHNKLFVYVLYNTN